MSGRKTIVGPCNKKLENCYRMKLFQKEMSVFFSVDGLNIVVQYIKILLKTS